MKATERGSLAATWANASRASSSRMGTPPTSKRTLPVGTLTAQYSKGPFPLPIRVSLPLTETGVLGNTLMKTLAPLTTLSFLLSTSSATVRWSADNLPPLPLTRMPYSPNASVVPFTDPPVGMGMAPFCLFMYLTFFGANWLRKRTQAKATGDEGSFAGLQRMYSRGSSK